MNTKEKFCVNVATDLGEIICSRLILEHLPRVGDAIKRNARHFAIIYVEWNMDELESAFTRVDIEVEEI